MWYEFTRKQIHRQMLTALQRKLRLQLQSYVQVNKRRLVYMYLPEKNAIKFTLESRLVLLKEKPMKRENRLKCSDWINKNYIFYKNCNL